MSKDEVKSCTLENEKILKMLENLRPYSYYNVSLKSLIDTYYSIYENSKDKFEEYKMGLLNNSNKKLEFVFKDMTIENVRINGNGFEFEFVLKSPISFRLPFYFECGKEIKYIGEKENSFISTLISASNNKLSCLNEALRGFSKIGKSYAFDFYDLPYAICLESKHIFITKVDDTSNNMVSLVDIDIEDKTLTFDETIDNDEFTSVMFKDYLAILLDCVIIRNDEGVSNPLGYPDKKIDFTDSLLIKYNLMTEKEKEEEKDEELSLENEAYYIALPDGRYKLIKDYKNVSYDEKIFSYEFTFDDYSKMLVPFSSIIRLNTYYDENIVQSNAYDKFKSLILMPKEKKDGK